MAGKSLLMIVGDYVEDYEAMVPFQTLQVVGHDVDVVCPEKEAGDRVKTAVHDERGAQTYSELEGHEFPLNATFEDIDPAEYDGLVLPGGRAPEYLRLNDSVLDTVQQFFEADKPAAVLCHAAQILIAADVIEGRTCTSYPGLAPDIEAAGGEWVDEVTVDGNLVTGRLYNDHPDWLREFIEVLGTEIEHGDPVTAPTD